MTGDADLTQSDGAAPWGVAAAPESRSELSAKYRQFAGLAFVSIVFISLAALYLVNLVNWAENPDFGWSTSTEVEGLAVLDVHGAAKRAGMRVGDRVVGVNGRAARNLQQVREHVDRDTGASNTWTVQRGEQLLEITVPNVAMGFGPAFLQFGITWLVGILFFVLGAVVFFMKPGVQASWAFLLSMFVAGIHIVFTNTSQLSPAWLGHMFTFSAACFAAPILHLAQCFPAEQRWVHRNRWLFLGTPYALSVLLFLGMAATSTGYADVPVEWKKVANIYRGFALVVFFLLILQTLLRSGSAIARTRAKIILAGIVVATGPPMADLLSEAFTGTRLLPHPLFNLLFYPAWPLSIGYSIVKHNLFDVDVYVKRAVGYAIMTVVAATTYFLLQAGLTQFVLVPLFGEAGKVAYPFVFAILVAFLFHPLNARVQTLVEKVFFRKQFDYKETVSVVQTALSNLLDPNEMASRVLGTIREEMFIDTAGVVLLQDGDRACLSIFASDEEAETAAVTSRDRIEPSDPLIRLIDQERKLITEYDLKEDARYRAVRETCSRALAKLGATLAFPMLAHERLVGALFVGHKKSGKFYTREDIDLLQSLSTHGAIAIENARLVHIKGTFSHYLAPAVVEELVAHPEKLRLGGERREITALFSDIAGFTTTSESMAPEELVHVLNEYFSETCDVVLRHGATIDKIVGDALHLLFNAPIDQPDHPERAVRCGLALSECSRRLRTERGLVLGDTRVGINTGFAVVGNFGGSARFDYTAHGDAMNTAARLEGANKYLGTPICVSAETRGRCSGIAFRPVGKLILEGKKEPVEVYEPLQPLAASETPMADYQAAYELMARRDPGARDAFVALAERFPGDGLIRFHADRLRAGEVGDTIRLSGK